MLRVPTLLLCTLLVALIAPATLAEDRVVLDSPEAVKKAMGSRDAAVRLAAARTAAGLQDHLITAPLVKLLKDKERPVREAAIEALAGRVEKRERKSAANGLAARIAPLAKDEQAKDELLLVIQALHDLAQPTTIKTLMDVTVNDEQEIVRARAMAVANIPDAEAIERLLQLGSKGRRHTNWQRIARDALRYATGVQLRGDADAWRQWWRENKGHFSFEAAAKRRADERDEKQRKAERAEEKRRKQEEKRRERGERKRGKGGGKNGEEEEGSSS